MRLVASCLAALAVAPAGRAHVTVVPPFARAGTEARLVLHVQNDRPAGSMSELAVRVPTGMTVRSGEPRGRWTAAVDGREVRWRGGLLGPRQSAPFALVVTTPGRAGAVELEAVQRYPDGGRTPWTVPLTVTPATDGADQHLGAAAVVAVVGLTVIGLGLLVVHRLRRPLQER